MKIRIKHFLNSIFRYRIASVCFVVGQLIIYFSVFGALQIYNMASLKEEERKEALYDNRIKIEAVSTDKIDIFSNMGDNVEFGNMILSGRLVLPVKETGIASTTEIIIKGNEEFPYIMESGRLPGTDEDSGKLVAALGSGVRDFVVWCMSGSYDFAVSAGAGIAAVFLIAKEREGFL